MYCYNYSAYLLAFLTKLSPKNINIVFKEDGSMETIAIELMQDFSEIVHYEHTGIPLYIRTADLAI